MTLIVLGEVNYVTFNAMSRDTEGMNQGRNYALGVKQIHKTTKELLNLVLISIIQTHFSEPFSERSNFL